MVRVIRIPETLDLSHDSGIWNLLCSRAFSKLRSGLGNELSNEELMFLRKEFNNFCVLTDSPLPGEQFVEKDKDLTIDMMERASYTLTRLEVSR